MITSIIQFATAEPASGGIFGALGIEWKTLILQIIAFLILVWLLGKFVYPWLMRSVDERHNNIEAAAKAAAEAQAAADNAQVKVAKMLKEAQVGAADIIATAKIESASLLSDSEQKAKKRSEQIVINAQDEIKKEIIAAKKALHNETLELVAMATEKVIGKIITNKADAKLIDESIKEVK